MIVIYESDGETVANILEGDDPNLFGNSEVHPNDTQIGIGWKKNSGGGPPVFVEPERGSNG